MATKTSARKDPRYALLMDDTFSAVGIAEGFVEPEDDEHVRVAWQVLHDSGMAYRLQGFFGRTARELISDGLLEA